MNVGLYSGAAGMRVGEDYQQMISENLSLQNVPGYRRSLPVFSTDPTMVAEQARGGSTGNPAALRMTRVTDFSQGPLQPSGSPYHLAIEGQAFFEVKEADGTKSFTRNGSFQLSPKGQLITSDGAKVLGQDGAPVSIDTSQPGTITIAADGTISQGGTQAGKLALAHFDNPSAALQPGYLGRFFAPKASDAKPGLAANDHVVQGSLEQSNGNPVEQMADMIQAVRQYEANSKSIHTVDDTQNQLITTLGQKPS
jgi:flagellar basal body rod protein FlgG